MTAVDAVPTGPGPGTGGSDADVPVDPRTFPIASRTAQRAASGLGDEVGDGPFGRAVAGFAWGAALTALLAAANLPLVLLALLLRPDPSLTWLVALAAIPLGPALSAALYAVREHYVDPDVPVARAFARGYRLNGRDAAVLAVPACLLGGVLALVAVGGRDAGVPAVATGLALGVAVLLAVVVLHALALRTFYRLRALDAVQAAAYYLAARRRASLGTVALVAVAAAVATLASDLLLALLAGVGVWLWYRATAGLLRDAGSRFLTGHAPAHGPATPAHHSATPAHRPATPARPTTTPGS